MKNHGLWIAAACLLFAANAQAGAPCSKEDESAALDQKLPQDWQAIYESYKHFAVDKTCDDGAIAEDYSDTVVQTLAHHWDALPKLAQLSDPDRDFRLFVLRHIDATADEKDLKKIIEASTKQCPESLRALCTSVSVAAKDAYAELVQN